GGRLLNAQAAEESELNDLGPAGVDCREGSERVVEGHQVGPATSRDIRNFIEIDPRLLAATLCRGASPRVVEQYVSHNARGDGEELRPMLPVDVSYIDQAQIGFVHQAGGLNGARGTLVLHVMS